MKSLRILAWLCAAYYFFYALGFYLFGGISTLIRRTAPAGADFDGNAAFIFMHDLGAVFGTFAPWLFIGAVVCAVIAARLRQMLPVVPATGIALGIGAAVWLTLLLLAMRPVMAGIEFSQPDVPEQLRGYVINSQRNSYWSFGLFALLPPVLLFIFGRKAAKEVAAGKADV